jgi:hypothetical protein
MISRSRASTLLENDFPAVSPGDSTVYGLRPLRPAQLRELGLTP